MRTEEVVPDDGSRTLYTYNDAGLHVRTTDYDENGTVTCDIPYDFDALQRVIAWRVFGADGSMFKRFEVDYDSEGLKIEHRQYGRDDNLERQEKYLYDDNKLLVEAQQFDTAGKLRSRKIYTSTSDGTDAQYYDALGNPIEAPQSDSEEERIFFSKRRAPLGTCRCFMTATGYVARRRRMEQRPTTSGAVYWVVRLLPK